MKIFLIILFILILILALGWLYIQTQMPLTGDISILNGFKNYLQFS